LAEGVGCAERQLRKQAPNLTFLIGSGTEGFRRQAPIAEAKVSIEGARAVKEWLFVATDYAVTLINWAALIVIVIGAVEAFFQGLRTMFAAGDGHVNPDAWLRLGRWLVAGLTFQLAADILETAVTMSWEEVARLAAIAAIRTFLNFFLERDLGEVRRRGEEPMADRSSSTS
jgi:uncharacterized membrane protein